VSRKWFPSTWAKPPLPLPTVDSSEQSEAPAEKEASATEATAGAAGSRDLAPATTASGGTGGGTGTGCGPIPLGELLFSIRFKHWLVYLAAAAGWGLVLLFTTWDQDVNWVAGWHQWDANWYEQISKDGWGNDPHTLAFMPAFAWLAGGLAALADIGFDLSSLLLNVVCFFFAGVISSEYVARRARVSKWPVFGFHLCSPVAFYALMPYSDALFYLLFWVALIAAENFPLERRSLSDFAAESLFLFILPLVRLTSFALAVWVFFRRWYAAAVFATLAMILFINWNLTSEPLYFLRVQEEFAMPHGWFVHGLWQAAGRDLVSQRVMLYPQFWLQVSVLPLASTVLILLAALWMARRREYFWLVTMLAVAFMSRNQGYWRSVLRYDLPLTAFVALPWLAWVRPAADGGIVRRWLRPALAAIMIGALLGAGLFLQLSVGHRLHLGGWGY